MYQLRAHLSLLLSTLLLSYSRVPYFVAAQSTVDDYDGSVPGLWVLLDQSDRDPIELAPLTHNETAVTIPDYSLTDLLFRLPDVTKGMVPWTKQALQLYNSRVPLTEKTKVLYRTDDLLNYPELELKPTDTADGPSGDLKSEGGIPLDKYSLKITSLAGMLTFYTLDAQKMYIVHGCDCRENLLQKNPGGPISTKLIQLLIWIDPSPDDPPEKGWSPGNRHGDNCSPRFLAHGQVQPLGIDIPAPPYPVTQTIIQAHFDMVVDLLRNETAIPILESMKIQRRTSDRIRARIIKAAGLPASAIENMHGHLTVIQYALYQALHRGDNNCPIPTTECGKFAPNPCDQYPPKVGPAPA